MTYQNITDWNIAAKSFLMSIGMGTEDRGLIRKCFVWFLFSFADNSTNSLVCSFVSFQTPSRATWVLSTKTMSIGFNTRRDPSRVLNGGHEGWCCSRALHQYIVPLVGGTMYCINFSYDRCVRHHPSWRAPGPSLHPQYRISPKRRLQD